MRATDSTQKSRCPELTRVDLPVGSHSVGVHNVLEARGELVGPDQGGRRGVGGDAVDKGRDCRSTFTLKRPTSVATLHLLSTFFCGFLRHFDAASFAGKKQSAHCAPSVDRFIVAQLCKL